MPTLSTLAPYRPLPTRRHPRYYPMGLTGVGMGATGTQIAGTVVNTGATIAGSNTGAIAGALGVSVPIVGAAIAGITMAIGLWLNRMGPKQKRWTTQIADDATAQLKEIKRVYFATPYTPANQAAALGAVDQMLQAIQDGCGQSQMGEPGRRCIAERLVRGGSAPWCPTGTGCDYFTEYRDPIANDARAQEWANGGGGATTVPAGVQSQPTPGFDWAATWDNLTSGAGGAASVMGGGFLPMLAGGLALWLVVDALGSGSGAKR